MSNTEAKFSVPRRVVTDIHNGKSVIVSDAAVPNAHVHLATPGLVSAVAWATAPVPALPHDGSEAAPPGIRITPEPGQTRLLIVTFPPDAAMADPHGVHAAPARPGRVVRA